MSMATEPHGAAARGGSPLRRGPLAPPQRGRRHVLAAVLLAAVVLLGPVPVLFDHWWYPAHYLTDVSVDYHYAHTVVAGQTPYRDFLPEYPPLSLWVTAIPAVSLNGHAVDFQTYQVRFALEMFLLTALMAAVVVLIAARFWRETSRPYLAAVGCVMFVLAVGPLVENRFDVGVALINALVLLALVYRRLAVAALMVGVGCAFKITPIILLPLLVVLAGWSRRAVAVCVLALGVAAVGFLPYLFTATAGVGHVFAYQTRRPLEIESVLGLPVVVDHLLSGARLYTAFSYHSRSLVGPHSATMTRLSAPLAILALLGVSALLWRARAALRAQPGKAALGMFALYLAFLCTDRVLSPQYLIWLIPVAVIVALDDPLLGLAAMVTAALTQLEFPVLWHHVIAFHRVDLEWLCVRNLSLFATFALAAWRLWRLGVPSPA
jgi:uncharacterized membrane protein